MRDDEQEERRKLVAALVRLGIETSATAYAISPTRSPRRRARFRFTRTRKLVRVGW